MYFFFSKYQFNSLPVLKFFSGEAKFLRFKLVTQVKVVYNVICFNSQTKIHCLQCLYQHDPFHRILVIKLEAKFMSLSLTIAFATFSTVQRTSLVV